MLPSRASEKNACKRRWIFEIARDRDASLGAKMAENRLNQGPSLYELLESGAPGRGRNIDTSRRFISGGICDGEL